MPWMSTNLADAVGGISKQATAAVAGVNASLAVLDKQVQSNAKKATAVLGAVTEGADLLKQMQAAGLSTSFLAPEKGSWSTRLSKAIGAPPNEGFCCGSASIGLDPDVKSAQESLKQLKAMLEKPVAAATDFIDKFDIEDFVPDLEPEELAEVDTSELKGKTIDAKFSAAGGDKWVSATIGDLFPGSALSTANALNSAVGEGKSLLKAKNSLKMVQSFTDKGLSTVTNMLDGMSKTGVYTILLEPKSGGYLSRLKSEKGAPASSADMYSTGMVTIATGPDILSLTAKFTTLSKMLKG